jgi:hypothetical protein
MIFPATTQGKTEKRTSVNSALCMISRQERNFASLQCKERTEGRIGLRTATAWGIRGVVAAAFVYNRRRVHFGKLGCEEGESKSESNH